MVFVAGESGVGKTRLVSDWAAEARAGGARVISGDCVELADGELPYAPLVGALRPLARDGDPALVELPEAQRRDLAVLVPDLGGPGGGESADDRGEAQRRLFEALLAVLERLSADAPVLLAVEDIHWADASTRGFLSFLARNLESERVAVALTFRPDELHRRHPLRPLLAELERLPVARRVDLEPLREDEVADLVRDVLDGEPAAELVERLHRRSEGNPLFVEEFLAAGRDGRGPLAPSLRDALMVRVERLPRDAQELLRLLAAAQRADHALLEDAGPLSPAELRGALREAIAGHVVVVGGDDRYAFRHILLREVVYDDLLPGERADLHLALARSLERRLDEGGTSPPLASAVANHYHAAGDQPAALRSAVRAAGVARRMYAAAGAATLLERALELWERVPDAEALTGIDHIELLRVTARAHATADDHRRVALLDQAVREIRAAGDDRRLPKALRDRSLAEWSLGMGESARKTLDLARQLLPDDAPAAERLSLTVARLKLATLQSRYVEAIELGEEAKPDVDALGDDGMRSDVYNSMGFALITTGDHERGVALLRESREAARRQGHFHFVAVAYTNLADALNLAGRGAEAVDVVHAGLDDVPADLGSRAWLELLLAELSIDLGDLATAREALRAVGRTSGGTRVNLDLRRAELALLDGDEATAEAVLDEIESMLVDSLEPQFIGVGGSLRAELERRRGRLDTARDAIEGSLERVAYCSDDTVRYARLAATGAAVEADAAERARDLGDAAAQAAAVQGAELVMERTTAAAAEGRPIESAYAEVARAHRLRASGEPACDAWRAAAATWEALGRRPLAAVARFRGAEAAVAHGDRDGASELANAALREAREIGSAWLAGEVEGLAARARLRVDGAAAAAGNGAAGPEAGAGVDG